ncbi:MAG: hypothetical protein IKN04_08090 [Clostridia bacterium]|nr:hypothetical protein [Clostridia bacterium]
MRENLRNALAKKMISDQTVCELLGISRKTLYNKITGASDFTLEEALSIAENLLPEYNLRYLFARVKTA